MIRSRAKIARLLGTVSGRAEFRLLQAHYPHLKVLDACHMQDMEDADLKHSLEQLRTRCVGLCEIDLRGLGSSVGRHTRFFLGLLQSQQLIAHVDELKVTGSSVTLSFNGSSGSSVMLAVVNQLPIANHLPVFVPILVPDLGSEEDEDWGEFVVE